MPQVTNRIPSYRLHKAFGQGIDTIDGKDRYLGEHDTAERRENYDCIIAAWLATLRARRGVFRFSFRSVL